MAKHFKFKRLLNRETGGGSWRKITPDNCEIRIAKGGHYSLEERKDVHSYQVEIAELGWEFLIDATDVPFMDEEIEKKNWASIKEKTAKVILTLLAKHPSEALEFLTAKMENQRIKGREEGAEAVQNMFKKLMNIEQPSLYSYCAGEE
jgi:hypothetical protein